jgi:hypothetical protein
MVKSRSTESALSVTRSEIGGGFFIFLHKSLAFFASTCGKLAADCCSRREA